MVQKNSLNFVKIITLVMLLGVITACGGGRTSTSSNVSNANPGEKNAPGTVELAWLPPTAYTDDTPITELAGHNIYINDGSGFTKLTSIDNPGVTSYVVEGLSDGSYTFVVTAYDSKGIESAYSNEADITISSS